MKAPPGTRTLRSSLKGNANLNGTTTDSNGTNSKVNSPKPKISLKCSKENKQQVEVKMDIETDCDLKQVAGKVSLKSNSKVNGKTTNSIETTSKSSSPSSKTSLLSSKDDTQQIEVPMEVESNCETKNEFKEDVTLNENFKSSGKTTDSTATISTTNSLKTETSTKVTKDEKQLVGVQMDIESDFETKEKITNANGLKNEKLEEYGDECPSKKILLDPVNNNDDQNDKSKLIKQTSQSDQSQCKFCKQFDDQILMYNGHQNNSCEEIITISTKEDLLLFTGNEICIDKEDEFPSFKITHFSVYDEKGHLCSFDTGLIEKNIKLYVSGYVKSICEENASPDGGYPTHDIGPINEWWTTGFDGGEKVLIGIASGYAEYYLMEPSKEYVPFWKNTNDKVMVWKLTIEFLLDECLNNPSYEDLIQHLETSGKFDQSEEILLKNAQFVCNQVQNYYEEPPEDEPPLISLSCMRSLIKLAGITLTGKHNKRSVLNKTIKKKGPQFTKATTTKLVGSLFENIFPDQLDNEAGEKEKSLRKKRCGVCEACQLPDCGKCTNCKNMLKFGGNGKSKQACFLRKCPYVAIEEAELSDNEEEKETQTQKDSTNRRKCSKKNAYKVEWIGESYKVDKVSRKYYNSVKVGENIISKGDFVMCNSDDPAEPMLICKVTSMYENLFKDKLFHAHFLCRGSDTVLGETSDPRELFAVFGPDFCEECPLGTIIRKAEIEFRTAPDNWADIGGTVDLPKELEDDGCSFFVTKTYDSEHSRFIDFKPNPYGPLDGNCQCCIEIREKLAFKEPKFENNQVQWRNEMYSSGTAVFLSPDVYTFKKYDDIQEIKSEENVDVDEIIYPEFFRKTVDKVKGSNNDTIAPFVIGLIEEVIQTKKLIKVRLLCRPDDTSLSMFRSYMESLNLVYWTDLVISTDFSNVKGKCYLMYGENVEDPDDWARKGPYRFYFSQAYDVKNYKIHEVPSEAVKVGFAGKGKGIKKGKSSAKSEVPKSDINAAPEWSKIDRPLRCMDVFAGCGGLSEGLHQAGIVETKWAIEKEKAASQAFKLNNPDCKVFHNDCNDILRDVLSGEGKKRGYPEKGEVELLVGGPPCQGFSGMNRFNAGQYSLFKSSLMVSFLSYCEYYRPKYFILENVRNFVSFKRNMVLKLTIRCLLAMGYQVRFGVLQAGHYGVPQTRRRLIIMAAAPGYILPSYPEPQHVFNKRCCQLSFVVGNTRFSNGNLWTESAPYRTICVRDAISDLPDIKNGWNKSEMPYSNDAACHFQKTIRRNNTSIMVLDHVCKEMSAIVEGRITQIPTYPGADWRDLPNIVIKLSDGTTTNKLRYPYEKKKRFKKDELRRGVCVCVTGKPCDPTDRQNNTLIPWCLPHTADRHNHWSGLYGRLEWDGFFGTTITNPEPMGKQGRVLHPEQHRVVSVRECARSQGFPDRFKFYGNILEKHRQVGNAVPPPLGRALGKEILRAYAETLKLTVK